MFTPTLRCECAQPGLIDTMRKWCIDEDIQNIIKETRRIFSRSNLNTLIKFDNWDVILKLRKSYNTLIQNSDLTSPEKSPF